MEYQKLNNIIENECIICLETVNTKYYTKCLLCNKIFHNNCLSVWKKCSLEHELKCIHCNQNGVLRKKKRNFIGRVLNNIYLILTCKICCQKK